MNWDLLGTIMKEQTITFPTRSLTAPPVLVETVTSTPSTSRGAVSTPPTDDPGRAHRGPSSSTPSSDFAMRTTPDSTLVDEMREFVKELHTDLGLIATILRLHFGATYFNKTPPHTCVESNPETLDVDPWRTISATHFTEYATELWDQVKAARVATVATPSGKVATLLFEVIIQGHRVDQYVSRCCRYSRA